MGRSSSCRCQAESGIPAANELARTRDAQAVQSATVMRWLPERSWYSFGRSEVCEQWLTASAMWIQALVGAAAGCLLQRG